jgi:hypothetical protein
MAGSLALGAGVAEALPGGIRAFSRQDHIAAPDVDFARLADLDGDGDLDFLGVEPEDGDVLWWENLDGSGTRFPSTPRPVSTIFDDVTVASAGDVDGDGDADVLVLRPADGRIEFFRNDGAGAFTHGSGDFFRSAGATHIELADVDGDGFADVFVIDPEARDVVWWRSNGQPAGLAFERQRATSASSMRGVTRIDAIQLDGDGLVDFVAANNEAGRVTVWLHRVVDGEHTFENVTDPAGGLREPAVADVAAADFDSDGDKDILTLRMMPYQVFLWTNDGSLGFQKVTSPQEASDSDELPWNSLDWGDVNGDGAVDFATSELDGRLCWYENDAPVAPTPPTPTATGSTQPPSPTYPPTTPPPTSPTPTASTTPPSPTATTATATRTAPGPASPTASGTATAVGATATATPTEPPAAQDRIFLPQLRNGR